MREMDKLCERWREKRSEQTMFKKSVLIARHGIVLYFPNGMVTALILAEDNYKTDSL